MIRELETVVLSHDVPQHDLKSGDVGAVVHRYGDAKALEVEFVTAEGRTVAVLTREILHVREFGTGVTAENRQNTRTVPGYRPLLPPLTAATATPTLKAQWK